ncbi:MAG TPA: beta-ketoacyl-[acyl-carrier-protein] synthase family protein [Pirellulales bacterium]|nr:beta-ketoacyl-[acyl-carrier-protein] synthase family protein [Pirellulales bacterium]
MSLAGYQREVVITGLGVVSPIGIGREAFWSSLQCGQSGVRPITRFDASRFPVQIGAEVVDFDPKAYVRPRKSLKVMSREIQYGFAAADMAMADANMVPLTVAPDRIGVVFAGDMIYCGLDELESLYRQCLAGGEFDFRRWAPVAMSEVFPLFLLRNLPNMIACHVAIAHDARGPCNTIGHSDVGSLAALAEGVRVIQRDAADVMVVGGVGARINPTAYVYRGAADLSHLNADPSRASRPFDAQRDGLVNGEGAAAFVLESLQHAQRRGAQILARVLSHASAHEPLRGNQAVGARPLTGFAVKRVLAESLRRAQLEPADIGHVNAHGLSTIADDRYEAQAIRAVLGDVPVTAPKSFFGHLGGGGGAVELAASILGLNAGEIPVTLNYEHPDPECPVNVIHGAPLPVATSAAGPRIMSSETTSAAAVGRTALKLSTSRLGHAAALIIAAD